MQRAEVERELYMEVYDILERRMSWITRDHQRYESVTEKWQENWQRPLGSSKDYLGRYDRNTCLGNIRDLLYDSVKDYWTQLTVEQLARKLASDINNAIAERRVQSYKVKRRLCK